MSYRPTTVVSKYHHNRSSDWPVAKYLPNRTLQLPTIILWANWSKPACIGGWVHGARNTMAARCNRTKTNVGRQNTSIHQNMDMPLSCSTGTRKAFHEIWWHERHTGVRARISHVITKSKAEYPISKTTTDSSSKLRTGRMRNTLFQGWCKCSDRSDNCAICNLLRKYPGWRLHRSASASVLSYQIWF